MSYQDDDYTNKLKADVAGVIAVKSPNYGGLGSWLSAALDDPMVCEEMKADIGAWFAAGEPNPEYSQQVIDDMIYAAAQALDHPSVYMDGPSKPSIRRAKMCIQAALGVASKQKVEKAK